ncbi:MAG: hypothetical protein CSB48_03280 [Proteobacteria bacterium]|nr:MAG: hypothetical protein CSB48_03280 [Pseudomonadota bacterium]
MPCSRNANTALNILLVTDGKPGHLNQLKGLLFQLQNLAQVTARWVNVNDRESAWLKNSWLRCFTRQKGDFTPDIVIGAGRKTQKQVLILGRHAQTCILMKPHLPLFLFDYAIIPAHDNVAERKNVLTTEGVLNQVRPQTACPATGHAEARAGQHPPGLMLIGGESRHYEWSGASIISQVVSLVSNSQRHWHLTNSRRTPDEFLPELRQQLAENNLAGRVSVFPHDTTGPDWLTNQYQCAEEIWVTPDSVSMVYEAITSGAATGLFDMTPLKTGRIVTGINKLIEHHRVTPFACWKRSGKVHRTREGTAFCEAERAARWLLEQLRVNPGEKEKSTG